MLLLNILLALAWVALTGQFTLINFITGLLLGFGMIWLGQRAMVPEDGSSYAGHVRQAAGLIAFFAAELVLSTLRVTADVLRPRLRVKPAVVAIPLDDDTNIEITLLANLITLTPGTLSLDVSDDRRVLYVHSIHVDDVDAFRRQIKRDYEYRVREVFE